ncbi:MAG: hypothetical protein D6741_16290 [Planctomycetota bacterium]|nr:MAG: hypothetical protein D6741_16290 [Planctomycetota bacterium]
MHVRRQFRYWGVNAGRERSLRAAAIGLLFTVAAVFVVQRAVVRPFDRLPGGRRLSATVPMLNAWTVWWNADRLTHGFSHYWDAPIFYPVKGTFAFSDPQPATCVVAPVVWGTGSAVPAYQIYVVLSLVLNGVFAYRLGRRLSVDRVLSAALGMAVVWLPLVHLHSDVLQWFGIWPILWMWELLLTLRERPKTATAILLGVSYALLVAVCTHHALLIAISTTPVFWVTAPRKGFRRWITMIGIAGVTAGLLSAPIVWPMAKILREHRFARSERTVDALSATWTNWASVPPSAWEAPAPPVPEASLHALNPGWGRVLAAAGGVIFLVGSRRRRAAGVFLLLTAVGGVLLSLGPHLHIWGLRPWEIARECCPPLAMVRNVFRFAYATQLAVVVLAAVGWSRAVRWCASCVLPGVWRFRSKVERHRLRVISAGVLCGLGGLGIVLEHVPPPAVAVYVPDVRRVPDWVAAIREHVEEGEAVCCLPFGAGRTVYEVEPSARWMMYGTKHGRPLVNGYSGFFPREWFEMGRLLGQGPITEEGVAALRRVGVRWLVVDRKRMPDLFAVPPAQLGVHRVWAGNDGMELWRTAP